MIRGRSQAVTRSTWFMPVFCVGLGLVLLAVNWLGGQLIWGVVSLVIMAALGLVIMLLAGRSETIRGLTVRRDERFAQIDLRATAVSGLAVLLAAVVAWLVATASGRNGHPYDWLVSIGAISYVAAVAFFRWRG